MFLCHRRVAETHGPLDLAGIQVYIAMLSQMNEMLNMAIRCWLTLNELWAVLIRRLGIKDEENHFICSYFTLRYDAF